MQNVSRSPFGRRSVLGAARQEPTAGPSGPITAPKRGESFEAAAPVHGVAGRAARAIGSRGAKASRTAFRRVINRAPTVFIAAFLLGQNAGAAIHQQFLIPPEQ